MEDKYSIDEVFKLIGEENLTISEFHNKKGDIYVKGFKVRKKSLRYMTFYQKGINCVHCGRKGAYFKLEGDPNTDRRHFNLYTEDDVLMTKDHIIPAAIGGLDHVDNLQPMCAICNSSKGDKIPNIKRLIAIDDKGNQEDFVNIEHAIAFLLNRNAITRKSKMYRLIHVIIDYRDKLNYAINQNTMYQGYYWEYREMMNREA